MNVHLHILLVLAACLLVAACRGGKTELSYPEFVDGDAVRGQQVIRAKGCGACHAIPGIREARGRLGPPLGSIKQRTFIAGELPHSSENLVRWLLDPHAIDPTTAMPDLGLNEQQARDIAAYLYKVDEDPR